MVKRISPSILAASLIWFGCSDDVDPQAVDCSQNPVTLQVASVTDSECGATDGSIDVAASGGSGTYEFQLGNGTAQSSGSFDALGAGVYEITAIDENNCTATVEATVRNAGGLNISATGTDAGGCEGSSGSITITATDGQEPYEYRLNDEAFAASNVFAGLPPGVYEVAVHDATGCEVTQSVRVTSGISFEGSIKPIIESKCAILTCHNGNQVPDFRVFANVQGNAAKIKELTGNRTMPQQGSLTQQQIDMIACWVDDGAPNN